MKTAISIPDPLFEEADEFARRAGVSRSELYAKALAAYLQEQRTVGVKEALDEVYGREPSELDAGLAALQSHILEDEDS